MNEGAELLANIGNDGWFVNTSEPVQHFLAAILRTVESDRWLVRASNRGVSGIVNPVGEVIFIAPLASAYVLHGTVTRRRGQTFYSRYGGGTSWACLLIIFALTIRSFLPYLVSSRSLKN